MTTPLEGSRQTDGRKLVLSKTMVVETNHVCNLRCAHCYVPSAFKRPGRFLDPALVEDLFDQFETLGFGYVLLTGGEPLVHPSFEEIYESAWDRGFHVSLFTNGLLLDERRMDLLTRKPPAVVRISLFGGSPAAYAEVAGHDGYDQVRARALELHQRGVPVRVKFPLLRHNASDAASVQTDLGRQGVPCKIDVRIIPRFDGDREILKWRLAPEEILELGLEHRGASLEKYRRLQRQRPGPVRTLRYCLERCQPFVINPEGRLQLCFLIRDWSVDLRRYRLSQAITTLARSILAADLEGTDDGCNACPHRSFCSYCPGWARNETGRAGEPIPFLCRLAEMFDARYRRLNHQRDPIDGGATAPEATHAGR